MVYLFGKLRYNKKIQYDTMWILWVIEKEQEDNHEKRFLRE